MNIVLLGLPGSGKGTQAKRISQKFNIVHISTGDIIRRLSENNLLDEDIKSIMRKGGLIPDEVVIRLVESRLSEPDCEESFMLDGFPRNLFQAKELDKFLGNKRRLTAVIYFRVSQEEVIRRISGRRVCKNCQANKNLYFSNINDKCDNCGGELYQREDDKENIVKNRLTVAISETEPLVEYYRNQKILLDIDASGKEDMIFDSVSKALERYTLTLKN